MSKLARERRVDRPPIPQRQFSDRLLDVSEVLAAVPISLSTINRLELLGQFPRRRSLSGKRRVGWLLSEVEKWLTSRARRPIEKDGL
jgi:prophage regulatory protein